MSKSTLVLIILCICTFGCGKKIGKMFSRNPEVLSINEVSFDYFSGKIKIDYDGDKKLSGTANMRMKKDSLIWISLSPGLGVEVARIHINKDSISIIDKFNKKYIVMDFKGLSKKFDFDISYEMVEAVLLGNPIYPYRREKLRKSNTLLTYDQQQNNFYFKNGIGSSSMKLERLEVQDTLSKSSIYVNYGSFQPVEDQIMPHQIGAKLRKGTSETISTSVDLEYTKAEIEDKPLKFPFNVPQKYERSEAY
ncbi:DUF4292 domain-containing protein [Marinoscillum sp. MHG1-6]|uniref:DUF4292 domain-containing protein n=1 Tax=Marinoscillum sp. MHG1-6 TaxID=2959627 RepID=UPI00215833FF|nr:DUF4292 domain-containing protein [Marinoscillum sp. MHG1-6]